MPDTLQLIYLGLGSNPGDSGLLLQVKSARPVSKHAPDQALPGREGGGAAVQSDGLLWMGGSCRADCAPFQDDIVGVQLCSGTVVFYVAGQEVQRAFYRMRNFHNRQRVCRP